MFESVKSLFNPKRLIAPLIAPRETWRDEFAEQEKYRYEGIAAAHRGLTAEDNPYDKETQETAHNFWDYGNSSEFSDWYYREHPEMITYYTTGDYGSPTPEQQAEHAREHEHYMVWYQGKVRDLKAASNG